MPFLRIKKLYKMKQLFFIVLVLSLVACTSENNTNESSNTTTTDSTQNVATTAAKKVDNDWAKKNLKGQPQSREIWVYEAAVKDGYVTNGALKGGRKSTYNQDGNELESVTYNAAKEEMGTWKYQYDANGKCTESTFADGRVNRRLVYTYDDKGNRTTCEEMVNDELVKKTTYEYDAQGREIAILDVFVSGNIQTKREHQYDGQGNKQETNIYDEEGNLNLKQFYVYNAEGKEIERSIFNGNNTPSYKRKFKYDEKGNAVGNLAFDADGKVNASDCSKFSYEYDEQGNWTTRVTSTYDDVAKEFSEQKITYFNEN